MWYRPRYHEQPFSWTWYRRDVIYATMHSLFVQLVSSPLPSHKHGLKWYRNVRHTYHLTDSRHLAVPHTTPPRHCCKSPALVLPHTHKWSKWYRCWYQLGRLGGRGGRGSRRHSVMQQCARRARGGVGAHHLQPVKWYQSRYHFCSCVSTWYDRRYRLLRSWIRGTNLGTTCSTRGYVVRT